MLPLFHSDGDYVTPNGYVISPWDWNVTRDDPAADWNDNGSMPNTLDLWWYVLSYRDLIDEGFQKPTFYFVDAWAKMFGSYAKLEGALFNTFVTRTFGVDPANDPYQDNDIYAGIWEASFQRDADGGAVDVRYIKTDIRQAFTEEIQYTVKYVKREYDRHWIRPKNLDAVMLLSLCMGVLDTKLVRPFVNDSNVIPMLQLLTTGMSQESVLRFIENDVDMELALQATGLRTV
jgi:hypothetical protein